MAHDAKPHTWSDLERLSAPRTLPRPNDLDPTTLQALSPDPCRVVRSVTLLEPAAPPLRTPHNAPQNLRHCEFSTLPQLAAVSVPFPCSNGSEN
jgi:hypothetical protein